jgi:Xaa-Pro dipeptidase
MMELQCEALFKAWTCYFGASRHTAYNCICGSGAHGAILHYGHAGRPNDKKLDNGDRIVLDMGSEFSGYATDITRSYPVNGKFTDDQKAIHNAVLSAQQAVIKAMKPGVSWPDMHLLAEKTIIEHLLKIGILWNGTAEEIQKAFVGAVFMCHGLGHLLGLNVHDVGGYPAGVERSKDPGLCWLRCGRKLEAGMVITVEPGIYFNDGVIDKALKDETKAKFINEAVLKRFRGKGGVRIEDDVLVTDKGAENFTVVPTTVEDIEEVMQGAKSGFFKPNRGTCFVCE